MHLIEKAKKRSGKGRLPLFSVSHRLALQSLPGESFGYLKATIYTKQQREQTSTHHPQTMGLRVATMLSFQNQRLAAFDNTYTSIRLRYLFLAGPFNVDIQAVTLLEGNGGNVMFSKAEEEETLSRTLRIFLFFLVPFFHTRE